MCDLVKDINVVLLIYRDTFTISFNLDVIEWIVEILQSFWFNFSKSKFYDCICKNCIEGVYKICSFKFCVKGIENREEKRNITSNEISSE